MGIGLCVACTFKVSVMCAVAIFVIHNLSSERDLHEEVRASKYRLMDVALPGLRRL